MQPYIDFIILRVRKSPLGISNALPCCTLCYHLQPEMAPSPIATKSKDNLPRIAVEEMTGKNFSGE
jgi:hypothetical protein